MTDDLLSDVPGLSRGRNRQALFSAAHTRLSTEPSQWEELANHLNRNPDRSVTPPLGDELVGQRTIGWDGSGNDLLRLSDRCAWAENAYFVAVEAEDNVIALAQSKRPSILDGNHNLEFTMAAQQAEASRHGRINPGRRGFPKCR